jgi:hypothetical protein
VEVLLKPLLIGLVVDQRLHTQLATWFLLAEVVAVKVAVEVEAVDFVQLLRQVVVVLLLKPH